MTGCQFSVIDMGKLLQYKLIQLVRSTYPGAVDRCCTCMHSYSSILDAVGAFFCHGRLPDVTPDLSMTGCPFLSLTGESYSSTS